MARDQGVQLQCSASQVVAGGYCSAAAVLSQSDGCGRGLQCSANQTAVGGACSAAAVLSQSGGGGRGL